MSMKEWITTARNLPAESPADHKLVKTFGAVLDLVHAHNWQGACHATSAIFCVLLREQNILATPFLGECRHEEGFFDHSWVEVDSAIYDIAISNPLIQSTRCPPVFRGRHLGSSGALQIQYGVISGQGLDPTASLIRETPFSVYMTFFPYHPEALWGMASDTAKGLGIRTTVSKLKSKHSDIRWQERAQQGAQADVPASGGSVA